MLLHKVALFQIRVIYTFEKNLLKNIILKILEIFFVDAYEFAISPFRLFINSKFILILLAFSKALINSKTLFDMPKSEKINFNFKVDLDQHIEHQRLIQNFTNFLLGKENLYVNGKDGLNSVELINAMVLSGLEEKKINLPLDENRYELKLEEMISKSR